MHIAYIIWKYRKPKKISIVFPNGSNHDYHFIIKNLPEELKRELICLEENIDFFSYNKKRSYKNW